MALEEMPLDESTTPIPPQATGDSLPGQAADLADIAPAGDFETELLRARLGEKGAQQYQDLRAAGQQASTPATPTPTPTPAAAPPAGPMANLAGTAPAGAVGVPQGGFNPLYTLLAGQGAEQQIVARNLQLQHAQNQLEQQNVDFLDKLQNEPLNVRAGMIHSWAARQGRDITPQEAQYIASISPEAMKLTTKMAMDGDVTAQATLKSLLGGNPIEMLTAKQTIEARNAQANAATVTSAWAEPMAEAKYAETIAKAAKEATPDIKTLYQGWRNTAIDQLHKQGIANPSETQIAPVVRELRAKDMGASRRETTAASPLPVDVAEKLAGFDTALGMIDQLDKMYVKGSPTDQARQSWLNRVKQEFNYRWGFDMPDNLDEDTALRSLNAITAGRAFIQGRPNQVLMNQIWKHTGENPLVSPNQMRDRLKIMRGQVTAQKNAIAKYTQMGRSDLAESEGHGAEGPGGADEDALQHFTDLNDVSKLPTGTKFYWQNETTPRTKN